MPKIQAVILAGGQGSRLRPYTTVIPKPLMPIDSYPIIEIVIRQLKIFNIKNIAISIGHLGSLIQAYCSNGKKWDVNIKYIEEIDPLGTAGAIKLIPDLENDFLAINGDILTDLNFRNLINFHKKNKAIATIAVKQRKIKTEFGVIKLNKKNEMVDYIEKPEYNSYVSTGINILNKNCRKYIGNNESIGIPELMLKMKNDGNQISCFKTQSQWLDLGRIDDLEKAQEIFLKKKSRFFHL